MGPDRPLGCLTTWSGDQPQARWLICSRLKMARLPWDLSLGAQRRVPAPGVQEVHPVPCTRHLYFHHKNNIDN